MWDYPANCLQPNCLLGGIMAGGNLSLCIYRQNASSIFFFFLNWFDISRLDKPICCLWLSKTSVTIKPHNGHYLESCRKWKFWSFLHTQLGLKWLINSFWNRTIGKSMSRLFCWFNLKILFETHHRRFNFTLQKLAELKNVHTQGEKNHL